MSNHRLAIAIDFCVPHVSSLLRSRGEDLVLRKFFNFPDDSLLGSHTLLVRGMEGS